MILMDDLKVVLKEGNITDEKGQITPAFIEKLQAIDKPVKTQEEMNAEWEKRYLDTFFNGTTPDSIETKTNTEEKSYNHPAGGIVKDELPDIDSFFKTIKE